MGVVHYRYRSGVQTFSVPVPGAFASVADLKRLIAVTAADGPGAAARGTASRSATPAPVKVRADVRSDSAASPLRYCEQQACSAGRTEPTDDSKRPPRDETKP